MKATPGSRQGERSPENSLYMWQRDKVNKGWPAQGYTVAGRKWSCGMGTAFRLTSRCGQPCDPGPHNTGSLNYSLCERGWPPSDSDLLSTSF